MNLFVLFPIQIFVLKTKGSCLFFTPDLLLNKLGMNEKQSEKVRFSDPSGPLIKS